MGRVLNEQQALTLPSELRIAQRNVNIIRRVAPTVQRNFLFSITRAMKYAEFLKLGARDIESPLVQSSLYIPSSLQGELESEALVDEYTTVNENRGDEIDLDFSEFLIIRNTSVSNVLFRDVIRGMGLKDERDVSFGEDLLSADNG